MKTKLLIITALLFALITCQDDDPAIPTGAGNQIVIEQTEDSVSYWQASYKGTLTNVQKRTIVQYGHCWDTTHNPTYAKHKTVFENTQTNTEFSSLINPLQPNKQYYIRSYFIIGTDTAYSNQNTFTTKAIKKPFLTKGAEPVTDLYTAIIYGKIADTGGEILSKGFYYSVNPDVSDADSVIHNTVDTLLFADTLLNLLPNTTYYVKAFATNRAGTGISNEFTFTTQTQLVELTTTQPTQILAYSCLTGGNITNTFGSQITQRGVCYSKNPAPTLNDSHTSEGPGSDSWVTELTGLQPNTTYYIRAYAQNVKGEAYGNELSFSTEIGLPVIETSDVTEIMAESAISGGKISDTGGDNIIEKGVCWNTTGNPTIDDGKTLEGSGIENFESLITNLSVNTTYYVRAYTTNSKGTAYGNEVYFTTKNGLIEITTKTASNITVNSVLSGGIILDNGGYNIIQRGVCYGLNQNPDIINNSFIISEEANIDYNIAIIGLSELSNYYIKAFATNGFDTAYGNQLVVKTLAEPLIDYDGNTYTTIKIGNQIWMAENLKTTHYADGGTISLVSNSDSWSVLTSLEKAYCYYDNNSSNITEYGLLYTWNTAMDNQNSSDSSPSGIQGVCPVGWHLPSDTEWNELITYVANDGYSETEGDALKFDNSFGDDVYGFAAKLGGWRDQYGKYIDMSSGVYFWSTTGLTTNAWTRAMFYDSSIVSRYSRIYRVGISVRCVKD